MKRSFQYVLYLALGFLIYEVIDSGETGLSHSEVKNTLIIGMVVVFVLLLVVRVIKSRYENGDEE